MLPNVIYIGPDKAGSTWIWRALSAHPEVSTCPVKDLYFFDRFYERGLAWYARQFPDSSRPVVLEVCHDYLYSAVAARRMAAELKHVRVFVSLRHPIERLVSGYLNMVRNGETVQPLEVAVEAVPELVDRSRYGHHLAPYLDLLGPARVGLFDFATLQRDGQAFFDDVCAWLGLSPLVLTPALLAPARPAERPRSRRTARAGQVGARMLRRAGATTAVGAMKHSALLGQLLYRRLPEHRRPTVTADLVAVLHRELGPDVHQLSHLTGTDYARRWGFP